MERKGRILRPVSNSSTRSALLFSLVHTESITFMYSNGYLFKKFETMTGIAPTKITVQAEKVASTSFRLLKKILTSEYEGKLRTQHPL